MNIIKTEKSRRRELLFDGATALAVSAVVTKVLGLLYKMPLFRIMGDEGMGYFNSAYTVYTFFYILCSAGVPKAVALVISENDAKGKRSSEGRIVKSALWAFLLLGSIATAVFIIFADALCVLIGNSGAVFTMLAVAPSVLFVSLAGVAKGHLNGNSKLLPLAVSQLIEGGAKFFLGIFFALVGVRLGFSLQLLSAFTVLGITLGSAASALYLLSASKKTLPPKSLVLTKVRGEGRTSVKKIIKIAVPLTLGAAVMSLSNMIDLAMIMSRLKASGYTEREASALYGNYTTLAVPMFNLVTSVLSPFFIAAVPLLSRSHTRGEQLAFEEELNITLRKALFVAVPSAAAFVMYSEEILSLIFTKESAKLGAPLLVLLAPALIFLTLETLVNTALEAKGFYKAPIISMCIGNIPKIIISYLLISNIKYGISAAPIGTLVSYAVGFLISVIILYGKTDIHVSFFRAFITPALASFSAISAAELFKNCLNMHSSFIFRLAILAVFGSIYLILMLVFNYLDKKRRKFLSICTKKYTIN